MPQWNRASKLIHGSSRRVLLLSSAIVICLLFGWLPLASTPSFSMTHSDTDTEIQLIQDKFIQSDDPIFNNTDKGPLVIENLFINTGGGPDGHAIDIRNFVSPVIIRNCYVTGIPDVSAIFLSNVKNCELRNLTVISNGNIGIEFSQVHNATVVENNVTANWRGLEIRSISWNVTIANNTVENNTQLGLYVDSSSSNVSVYYNTFDGNAISARDDLGSKANNYTKNFWSDYTGPDDVSPFKIGDIPYEIDGNEDTDPSPLMMPADRPPVYWITPPSEQTLELGTGFNYDLDVAVYGGLESWWVNDTSFGVDDSGVITEKAWLAVGTYGIEVRVRNLYFDTLFGSFNLHVVDRTKPVWTEIPVDQFVEMGDGFRYDLNATDFSMPLLFSLTDSPEFAIDGATGVITNSTLMAPDTVYAVNVSVRDNEGLTIFSEFDVTVRDSIAPEWSVVPSDRTVEFGFGFTYDLDATDPSGLDTWVVNDSRFEIDALGTITNATVLPVGKYALLVSVNDTRSNVLTDIFIVTVQDTTRPVWVTVPIDQIVEAGHILDLQLQASDDSGITFWTISDADNFAITTLGRVFSLGELDQITYTLTVNAYDPYGNYLTGQFAVTVQDSQPPVWRDPLTDQNSEFGMQVRILLRAYDPSGLTGWAIEESGRFSIGSDGVITNTTLLPVGEYLVHVSVRDPIGHILVGSFTIHIVDTTPPVIYGYPRSLNVTAPDTLSYLLNVSDLSAIDRWEVDDTVNFDVDQDGRLLSLGILPAGEYSIIVTAYDIYGNHNSVTIIVNAFALDAGALVIGGGVSGSVIILAFLVIFLFDPKRGRIGPWHGGGVKK